ncbi:hypothetical protein DMH01_17365 [Amycolatopsis sp. WAC 04182]|uniref:hypothetical protein n=1 Tax=Amycolatopsis sp. WAC 04182 TaxID=2203198 RepID=UPI000F7785B8|nr:hypothetical protein [Amycolatopsis sp. WAC 04182]RSN61010.1 hypothetical protein DMH01_17365 [Amycolatopsis sp. WAC 04182]
MSYTLVFTPVNSSPRRVSSIECIARRNWIEEAVPGQDGPGTKTGVTEDHVELCGTPIFDSLVEETRKAAAGNGTLPRDDNSESSEPRTDDGKESK